MNHDDFAPERVWEFREIVEEVQRYGYMCPRCVVLRERHPDWADVEFPLIHAVFHPEHQS
jgi:hypothetical protein